MTFDPASLKFDANGLIPAIAQDHISHEVLMMAWMNADAVAQTLATGRVTYWSRSRQAFWIKGESSGHVQKLVELRVDCDRDCLLVLVDQTGPACVKDFVSPSTCKSGPSKRGTAGAPSRELSTVTGTSGRRRSFWGMSKCGTACISA